MVPLILGNPHVLIYLEPRLVLFGVIFFGMVSIADESFIFRLAPTLFPNEPAAPLYASCCLMSR